MKVLYICQVNEQMGARGVVFEHGHTNGTIKIAMAGT